MTALSQLLAETGDPDFAEVVARVEIVQAASAEQRVLRYVDMVEENVVREDLTFAEMAQVAITAAEDPQIEERDPAALVARLYGALHKTKRSYVKSFVFLLSVLGEDLKWPKAVPRNLGVDAARALKSVAEADALKARLARCASEAAQNDALAAFVKGDGRGAASAQAAPPAPTQKLEFSVGETKVTARDKELRLVSGQGFSGVSRARLEEAIAAFYAALNGGPRIR